MHSWHPFPSMARRALQQVCTTPQARIGVVMFIRPILAMAPPVISVGATILTETNVGLRPCASFCASEHAASIW